MFSKYFLRHSSTKSFSNFICYMKWIKLMIIRILHVVWNYSLVYLVFSRVIHFLFIGFCLRLVWFTFHRRFFWFHWLLFIHFKPYIFLMCTCSWGLCNSLIWILLKKIHLILISNLFWKYTFWNYILNSIYYFVFLQVKNCVFFIFFFILFLC